MYHKSMQQHDVLTIKTWLPKHETENVVLRKHHGPQVCKKVCKNELIIVETEQNAANKGNAKKERRNRKL